MSPLTKHTILFLAADPLGTDRLALDQEARAIQVALERSGYRDKFELVTRWAAQPLDLLDELRKLEPTVVHFSGHGSGGEPGQGRSGAGSHRDVRETGDVEHDQHGLLFQGPDGRPQLVSTAALEETFGAAGSSVKLVVLNACYSEAQAEALLAHVGCVVGMGGSIRDEAARNFALGFYGGLGERQSVKAAYKQGCAAIRLKGLSDAVRPQLRVRAGVDADQLILADPETSKKLDQETREEVAPGPRRWTWRSTVESAEAGVVSVLAIVETIAASAVYAWIALRFGTLHLTISACVAPLLLLRTPRSVSFALDWFQSRYQMERTKDQSGQNNDEFLENDTRQSILAIFRSLFTVSSIYLLIFICIISLPFLVVGIFALPAIFVSVVFWTVFFVLWILIARTGLVMVVRVVATAAATAARPLESILEIPHNWWRSIATIDSHYPLETLPGAYRRYGSRTYDHDGNLILVPSRGIIDLVPMKAISDLFRSRTRAKLNLGLFGLESLLEYGVLASLGAVLLFPALLYRWSLKGSALIYSPLIWIVHGATARPLRIHLEDIFTRAYYRLSRWFAVFVLLLFAAKFYVYYSWSDFAAMWRTFPGQRLLDAVVMPDAFPAWQITGAVNAILAWILYLAAEWVVACLNRGVRIDKKGLEVALRWFSLLRGALSVYTIFCGIYLAASLSGRFGLPPIGTEILPWR